MIGKHLTTLAVIIAAAPIALAHPGHDHSHHSADEGLLHALSTWGPLAAAGVLVVAIVAFAGRKTR
ncbi:MAG: hypothetical protein ACFB2Z_05835 [Maricaulaceae bacterium]